MQAVLQMNPEMDTQHWMPAIALGYGLGIWVHLWIN
jgi:hypothetical protein